MEEKDNKNTATEQPFDKEQVYTAEVVPIMEKLEEVCERLGIPYLVWAVYRESDDAGGCGYIGSSAGQRGRTVEKLCYVGTLVSAINAAPVGELKKIAMSAKVCRMLMEGKLDDNDSSEEDAK